MVAPMAPENHETAAERRKTDENLDNERARADEALSVHAIVSEASADEEIESVREHTDAIVRSVRSSVDRKLTAVDEQALDAIERERAIADQAREAQQRAEDALREAERRATAQKLVHILPSEREKTDAALAEERARADEAIAGRDDTLAIVSHELRTLFGGIVMSAAAIEASASAAVPSTTVQTEAKRIQAHTFRMSRLLNDLLDVVSIDAGKLSCNITDNDPRVVVNEAIRVCAPAASAKPVTLETLLDDAPSQAAYDHDRMLQVLANLIGNAIKFTPPGGHVSVRCAAVGDDVELSVTDTGSGVPPELHDAVFEKFQQADAEGKPGVGLGLFIARSIVTAHKGRIWLENTSSGGARAVCVIPGKRTG